MWTAAVELELAKGETVDLTFAGGHGVVSVTDWRGNIRRALARFSLSVARAGKLSPLESDAASPQNSPYAGDDRDRVLM